MVVRIFISFISFFFLILTGKHVTSTTQILRHHPARGIIFSYRNFEAYFLPIIAILQRFLRDITWKFHSCTSDISLNPQDFISTNMSAKKGTTRRDRNREAVQKYRKKIRNEDKELEQLYAQNEQKINKLEKMVDTLSAELQRTRRT